MPDLNAAMTAATEVMLDAIGATATWTPAGGEATDITASFDDDFRGLNLATGMVESTGPALHCKSSDVAGAKHGDAFTVDGTGYTVTGIEPDGTGLTLVRLRKA